MLILSINWGCKTEDTAILTTQVLQLMNMGCLCIDLGLSFLSVMFYSFPGTSLGLLLFNLFEYFIPFDDILSGIVFLNFIFRLFLASVYYNWFLCIDLVSCNLKLVY